MLSRIFPKRIDNGFRGPRVAIWLLVPIVFVCFVMGANTMIHTRDVITGADAIPLDSYGASAARIIVNCFKSWALGLFLLACLGALALVRYRAMIPLMYLLFALENGGRRILHHSNPLHVLSKSGEPIIGNMINLALLVLMLIGFVLSLAGKNDAAQG